MATEIELPSERPTTSTRDRTELQQQLSRWLRRTVGDDEAVVSDLSAPSGNGMSSETVLFDATWREGSKSCVARLAPDLGAVPVFPKYELETQFRVMTMVGERTTVPVPPTLWLETDDARVGTPFFVMEKVDGLVPPDLLPYVFDSWLFHASCEDQRKLQDATIDVIAKIHEMEATPDELTFLQYDVPGATALARHVNDQRAYYDWMRGDTRIPIIDKAFAWLDANWPADEGDDVVSWGDSRIGNIMYVDFSPVAVLDWEMAGVGPRGLDLGWIVALHQFFQEIAQRSGVEGMPHFMTEYDVVTTYERLTGVRVADLHWYVVYGLLRHAIVMARIAHRSAHFGESVLPEEPDDLVMHRDLLDRSMA